MKIMARQQIQPTINTVGCNSLNPIANPQPFHPPRHPHVHSSRMLDHYEYENNCAILKGECLFAEIQRWLAIGRECICFAVVKKFQSCHNLAEQEAVTHGCKVIYRSIYRCLFLSKKNLHIFICTNQYTQICLEKYFSVKFLDSKEFYLGPKNITLAKLKVSENKKYKY